MIAGGQRVPAGQPGAVALAGAAAPGFFSRVLRAFGFGLWWGGMPFLLAAVPAVLIG